MNINLADFIGESVVSRDIERNGKSKTFRFAEISAATAEDLFAGVSTDQKKNKGLRARIIAAIVRDDAGDPAFTEKEAGSLPLWLANRLQEIALEVNSLGPKEDAEKKE